MRHGRVDDAFGTDRRVNAMLKPRYAVQITAVILLLLALILFLAPGIEVSDSETTFMTGLYTSLGHLDRAKWQWMKEKEKSEEDVPTMADLRPYLGDKTNLIERLSALGINYEITAVSQQISPSDIAIFTRDLRFRRGFCRFYPAGTRYGGPRGGWTHPDSRAASFRSFCIHNRERAVAVLFVLGIGTLVAFAAKQALVERRETPVLPNEDGRNAGSDEAVGD